MRTASPYASNSGPPRATGHLLVFEHGNVRHAVVRVVALVISDNDPSGRKVESRRERRRRDDYLDKVGAEPRLDEFPVVDEKAGVVKCRSVAHAVGELSAIPVSPWIFAASSLEPKSPRDRSVVAILFARPSAFRRVLTKIKHWPPSRRVSMASAIAGSLAPSETAFFTTPSGGAPCKNAITARSGR